MSDVRSGDQSYVTSRHFNTSIVTIISVWITALFAILGYSLSTIDKLRDRVEIELRANKKETIEAIERIVLNNKTSLQQQILERKRTVDSAVETINAQFVDLRLANRTFGQHLVTIASGNVSTRDISKVIDRALSVYSQSPNWRSDYARKLEEDSRM